MIKTLYVKNFILIDKLLLNFGSGFNVLLGETGAGKSIIIKAIDVALGAKTSKDVLKNPKNHALVELTFNNNGEELVISREISQTGTKCRINGALVNLDEIKNQREHLIDIHTQFQTYSCIQQKYHISLLDSYIASKEPVYNAVLAKQETNFKRYIEIRKTLLDIKARANSNRNKIEFLKFEIDEIERAEIRENEEEELNRELEILSNVQKLKELSFRCYFALGGEDNSVLEVLCRLGYNISKIREYDTKMQETEENFFCALENLKDISSNLRNYSESLQDNPTRLSEVNERLELIEKLKCKYGNIFKSYECFVQELKMIEGENLAFEDLEKESFELEKILDNSSKEITKRRKKYAQELSVIVSRELKKLEFECPKFYISMRPVPIGAKGADDVEFLITTNVAKEPAPLVKVASGGEISRIMLAIKTVFVHRDKLAAIIFDEIDSGISGKTSVSVANEIFELSKTMQVFAITHQPIIASKAQDTFWIFKTQLKNDTIIRAEKLNAKGKIRALAQMTAGIADEKSLNFAKNLIANHA